MDDLTATLSTDQVSLLSVLQTFQTYLGNTFEVTHSINMTTAYDTNPFGHVELWPNDKWCVDKYNYETFEKDLCFQHCFWGIDDEDGPGFFFSYRECNTTPSYAFQWHAGI